jgi:hypothetical protein
MAWNPTVRKAAKRKAVDAGMLLRSDMLPMKRIMVSCKANFLFAEN